MMALHSSMGTQVICWLRIISTDSSLFPPEFSLISLVTSNIGEQGILTWWYGFPLITKVHGQTGQVSAGDSFTCIINYIHKTQDTSSITQSPSMTSRCCLHDGLLIRTFSDRKICLLDGCSGEPRLQFLMYRTLTLKNYFSKNIFGKPTYIVAAKRTPIGAFLGKLSHLSATDLGAISVKAALQSINLAPEKVDEVILGNVCPAGTGQAPARQVSIKAGIPSTVPCTTINKVCSSGMKSVIFGAQSIGLGQSDIVVAGGFESMSNVPFYVTNHRKGFAFGEQKLLDGLAFDGLTDAFNNVPMGNCGEKTATDMKIGRKEQDDFAVLSYQRVIEATKSGAFKDEIVPVPVGKEGELLSEDEEHKRFNKEKMGALKTVFNKNGTITAANASKINDGSATIILASQEAVKAHGLKPLARIVGYADAEIEPMDFCIAPYHASNKVLERTGLSLSQIDFFEFNEAFSVTVLANQKLMDLSSDKVNVHGGAVALGHPIGMSGARIIQSLMTVLAKNKKKYGLAAICNGGGGSSALIIQNLRN